MSRIEARLQDQEVDCKDVASEGLHLPSKPIFRRKRSIAMIVNAVPTITALKPDYRSKGSIAETRRM